MKNNKDELGTINFIDIDVESGKLTTTESNQNSTIIPEIAPEVQTEENSTPLTQEQEEMLAGTYRENEEKRKIAREEAKIEDEKKKFKTLGLILVTVLLCFYAFGTYLKCDSLAQQVKIQERVSFLSNNASYNNNIRALFTNLRTNAVELQSGVRSSTIYKSKAKSYVSDIEAQINSLKDNKKFFEEYGASSLYENLDERLSQVLALAQYQKDHSDVVDVILKTNAYITAEETNKNSYLGILEDYLKNNKIPYSYEDGKLNYKID